MGLDSVELIIALEKHYGIDIPDEDAEGFRTVGICYNYILGRKGIEPGSAEAARVWEEYVDIVAEETGVERDRVVPHASFLEDLGVD